MARITRVEALMVDLKPKVKRVDAIQSFVSQETPIVRIYDADGGIGTGYSYTIGTGGHSVIELLKRTLVPAIIGREAMPRSSASGATCCSSPMRPRGAITSIALAAIDTALWDLKGRRHGEPLHRWPAVRRPDPALHHRGRLAASRDGGAGRRCAAGQGRRGFGGCKLKVGRPMSRRMCARIGAVREAVGPAFEIFTDANQRFNVDEAIRRARCL
jgi:L-alanine-DL-glutamate epimerase-like enolase superfamily enzyme